MPYDLKVVKKTKPEREYVSVTGHQDSHPLLAGMLFGTNSIENNLAIPIKIINSHTFFFFFLQTVFFFLIYFFIYLLLCWVFVSVRGLSPVVASGGHSSLQCAGLSLSRPLLLWSTGSRRAGSVIVTHGPSCSAACGIFRDQGSNPCPLHWQADS